MPKFLSGSTAEGGPALVSRPLDGGPGVASGHEVGVLPRGRVNTPARLVQVAAGVRGEGVVAVGPGHAVGPADRLHGGEGGGGGHLVAGAELSPGRVPAEAVDRDPVFVVAQQDTLRGVRGSSGSSCSSTVDVGVVVVLPRVGNVFLSLGPSGGTTSTASGGAASTTSRGTSSSSTSGGGVTQAGVQADALVSQGQRAVGVGEVVEEDTASDCQAHSSQPGVSDGAALRM